MAAPALDVPQPRTEPILVSRPQVGELWRRVLLRAVLVPLVVLAPLVALAPTADHRFNIYYFGGLYRDHPLRIVPDTLNSLPGYQPHTTVSPFSDTRVNGSASLTTRSAERALNLRL